MLYSTTRGTSGDIERETWLARQEALVNMFRYLRKHNMMMTDRKEPVQNLHAKVRVTGSCISMMTASSSLSTLAVWASLMLPVPMSPAAENLTPSLVQLITTDSPNWERSLKKTSVKKSEHFS